MHRHLRERGEDYRDRVRARPGLLDRGARDAAGPVAPAPPLAARARRDAVAPQDDDRPNPRYGALGHASRCRTSSSSSCSGRCSSCSATSCSRRRGRSGCSSWPFLLAFLVVRRAARRSCCRSPRWRSRSSPSAATRAAARSLRMIGLRGARELRLPAARRLLAAPGRCGTSLRRRRGWGEMKRKGFAVLTPVETIRLDAGRRRRRGRRTAPRRSASASPDAPLAGREQAPPAGACRRRLRMGFRRVGPEGCGVNRAHLGAYTTHNSARCLCIRSDPPSKAQSSNGAHPRNDRGDCQPTATAPIAPATATNTRLSTTMAPGP